MKELYHMRSHAWEEHWERCATSAQRIEHLLKYRIFHPSITPFPGPYWAHTTHNTQHVQNLFLEVVLEDRPYYWLQPWPLSTRLFHGKRLSLPSIRRRLVSQNPCRLLAGYNSYYLFVLLLFSRFSSCFQSQETFLQSHEFSWQRYLPVMVVWFTIMMTML